MRLSRYNIFDGMVEIEIMTMRDILNRALNEVSTMWGSVSGILGALTVNEWCLLITALITAFNFIKSWYIDMRKLKMLEEEHQLKLGHKNEVE